jgi:antitoxin component YwqK of YwqJK toxin-antitoxin module
MKIYSQLLSIAILLISCSTTDSVSFEELTIEKTNSSDVYSYAGQRYSGRVFQYAEGSENLVLDFNVLNGLLHEDYNELYLNGNPKRIAFFDAGLLNGLEEKYYENGQLKESVNYIKGNFNGKRMVYWINGILKEQNSFRNGILGGENLFYFSDGKLRKRLKFDQSGKRDGIWEDFYSNGQLKQRFNYKNGALLSSSDVYDFEGKIITK